MRSADEATYAAKMSGKDRLCIAPPDGIGQRMNEAYAMPLLTFCSMCWMAPARMAPGTYAC